VGEVKLSLSFFLILLGTVSQPFRVDFIVKAKALSYSFIGIFLLVNEIPSVRYQDNTNITFVNFKMIDQNTLWKYVKRM
jgi:hypothetical protein